MTHVRTGLRFPAVIVTALLAGAVASTLGVNSAHADTRTEAREAYGRGQAAYRAGDYETAHGAFKEANDLLPAPQAQFWLAMSLDQLDRDEEALAAFEVLIDSADFEKIGDDLVAVALGRRDLLSASLQQATEEEEALEGADEPLEDPGAAAATGTDDAADTEPEFVPWHRRLLPEAGILELGLFTGPLRISRAHNLVEPPNPRLGYANPAWTIGGRVGYAFIPNLGAEIELAHAEGKVDTVERRAQFLTFRGHLFGQLATSRVTPYLVAGIGGLKTSSDPLGKDVDFLGYFGAGAKAPLAEPITLRLDYRLDMTDRVEGLWSFHHEFLLGLSYTLRTRGAPAAQ